MSVKFYIFIRDNSFIIHNIQETYVAIMELYQIGRTSIFEEQSIEKGYVTE